MYLITFKVKYRMNFPFKNVKLKEIIHYLKRKKIENYFMQIKLT